MMKIAAVFALVLVFSSGALGQKIALPKALDTSESSLSLFMPAMAEAILNYPDHEPDKATYYDNRFRYELAAKHYKTAITMLDSTHYFFRDTTNPYNAAGGIQFKSFALAKEAQTTSTISFPQLYSNKLKIVYDELPEDAQAVAGYFFSSDPVQLKKSLDEKLLTWQGKDSLTIDEARALVKVYNSFNVYKQTAALANRLLHAEDALKYVIQDSLMIRTRDGAQLSGILVRKRSVSQPLPLIMVYSIYPGPADLSRAKRAADNGYVGMILNTRGKRLSPQEVEPFEHDAEDVYDAMDWIVHQPWSNGKIGMYGGSYLGFSQWSATKQLHPALKTIVPQVAVGIGIDYPMHNNVFMTYMLRWIHYVSNNKMTDGEEFGNSAKWDSLYTKWYRSGASFRSLDSLEGRPNAIFQRWLQHPGFDSYWQRMVPYKTEFARINIPVLTTTGYFDDDQRGAFYYLQEHYKWNKNAQHYLIIGPYDHGGGQGSIQPKIRNYSIDSVANIQLGKIVFQWFDYVLKGAAKPSFLKDRVNYEVAGGNEWRSAPDFKSLSNDSLIFYLSNVKVKDEYKLASHKPKLSGSIVQEVDYLNRRDADVQEYPLVDSVLHLGERLVFVSEPLSKDLIMNGSFTASIDFIINKKDIDLAADLYELQSDGTYFSLSNYIGRASYAKDRERRQLLQPGKLERVNFSNTFFISRKLKEGSRIVFTIGMNKSPLWEMNYGTGKVASTETVKDGAEPLTILWQNSSCIKIPILR